MRGRVREPSPSNNSSTVNRCNSGRWSIRTLHARERICTQNDRRGMRESLSFGKGVRFRAGASRLARCRNAGRIVHETLADGRSPTDRVNREEEGDDNAAGHRDGDAQYADDAPVCVHEAPAASDTDSPAGRGTDTFSDTVADTLGGSDTDRIGACGGVTPLPPSPRTAPPSWPTERRWSPSRATGTTPPG